MFDKIIPPIHDAQNILIIQAENPDGDSLASALALDELLENIGKKVTLFCAIDIPKYLRYITGWDRVVSDWPNHADAIIIVDTSSKALLEKTLQIPSAQSLLERTPVIVLDHHADVTSDLPFEHLSVNDEAAVSTGEVIYDLAVQQHWTVTQQAAEHMFISLQADTLGLTTPSTTAKSYQVAADLVALGAVPADIELRRREYMKKPADILAYKAELIQRIEYHLDGKLATVHIPWADIQAYSDRYNPSVLVLDEMRLVEGVEIAIAIKTYPDGKLTGKIRSNLPIAHTVAGYFGGGGHEHSAGFKIYESIDELLPELISGVDKAVKAETI
ncbi:MAG: putative phosphoesterase [Candidatus Saccharibacteria bacterium]|nr:putative phosphoesterase [Candidatus Saccharibacteria bacterium]